MSQKCGALQQRGEQIIKELEKKKHDIMHAKEPYTLSKDKYFKTRAVDVEQALIVE